MDQKSFSFQILAASNHNFITKTCIIIYGLIEKLNYLKFFNDFKRSQHVCPTHNVKKATWYANIM